jgi:hypothetical protein
VAQCPFVPHTYKSLACLWLITLGLFALTASSVVARSWLPLLLLVALAAPALILRSQDRVAVIARSRKRPRIVADAPDRSPWDLGGIDVYQWENEGGAAAHRASYNRERASICVSSCLDRRRMRVGWDADSGECAPL